MASSADQKELPAGYESICTVAATVTQTVPAEFSIFDAGGAQVIGNALVWTGILLPHEGLELPAVLSWEGGLGESVVLPGAGLTFEDPDTDQGDTYTAIDEEITAPGLLRPPLPFRWLGRAGSKPLLALPYRRCLQP